MEQVYFLRKKRSPPDITKRVGAFHSAVFHGIVAGFDHSQPFVRPGVGERRAEPLRLCRSGLFVPPVFMPRSVTLIVSESIKQQLAALPGTDFVEVVFAHLSDVSMPSLGDMSWYDRITYPPGPDANIELQQSPDVPTFHTNIGRYFEVLACNVTRMQSEYPDVKVVRAVYGTYGHCPDEDVGISLAMAAKFPVTRNGPTILSENAFAILAPHLDLDYFSIACHHLVTLSPKLKAEVKRRFG